MSVSALLPGDQLFQTLVLSQSKVKSRSLSEDNSPWMSAGSFGKEGSPDYYYLDDPTEFELQNTARNTEIGYRLTYGFAGDAWNNKFKLKFLTSELNQDEMRKMNTEITEHLLKIKFYQEFEKATAFNYEQGEALIIPYRKGEPLTATDALKTPPDITKEVVRVEAINKLDYNIPRIKEFGDPEYYNISFWKEGVGKPRYIVNMQRALRIRLMNIDYDQYRGQSALKACFASIQILLNIIRSAGNAAFRWGLGIPAIFTKNVKEKQVSGIKTKIGDPTQQKWMILPSENVDRIEMLGLQGSMMNLGDLADLVIDQIVAVSQIPRPILLGETAGVISGSEVNERAYFAILDKAHTKLEAIIREYFEIDPTIKKIIGNTKYEIDWGLRQVLTKPEEADLAMKKANVATSMMNFATLREVREYYGLPELSKAISEESVKYMYGPDVTIQILEEMIPNLGQWRQRTASEVLQTPEERQAIEQQEEAQMLERNQTSQVTNKGAAASKPKSDPLHDPAKELERRQQKMARAQVDQTMLTVEQIKQNLYDEIYELRNQVALNEAKEELGVSKNTFNSICQKLDAIRESKVKV